MSSVQSPFEVNGKRYSIQFLRLVYLDGYSLSQLDRLEAARVYDISFKLEEYLAPSGEIIGGYGIMGTGNSFQVLGGVANGIVDWATQHRPDYLHWYAAEPKRQRLYDRMVRWFAERGSGYHRVPDPFTGLEDPSQFWLTRI